MDIVPERAELVRCTACHELYEHAFTTAAHAGVGCPRCGATACLSARVPVEESAAAKPA